MKGENIKMKTQYFEFGEVHMTQGVQEDLEMEEVFKLLQWHGQLNKGLLNEDDQNANWYALKHNGRIVSHYLMHNEHYYVITEHDRSYTTVMRTEEY